MLWLQLAFILLLILLNGFFALAEMAVVSARRVRLQRAADLGGAGAKTAMELKRDPGRFLSTVQIGITVIGVLASALGGATFAEEFAHYLEPLGLGTKAGPISLAIVVAVISYLTLILGELVPKRVALSRPEAIARSLAPMLALMTRLAAPLVWFLSASSNLVLHFLPRAPKESVAVTEEEITIMLREAQQAGNVHAAETAIVQMALRLGDRRVNAVMTPRTQLEWLDLQNDIEDNRATVRDSDYSRFPVFDGGPQQVAGIVQVKDILTAEMTGKPFDLKPLVKPAMFIPETATALRALEMFRKSGEPMALVIDEFGDLQGAVTLDDILQSLVGDIAEPGEPASPSIERRPDGSFIVDGMTPLDQVRDLLNLMNADENDGDYHTLGGFVMARLHRIPTVGSRVTADGVQYEVIGMDGRRVDRVLISPPKAVSEAASDG
ncbi:MAG TPA: hemolysin family protein [Stellaceae bacterium]|jgi:putative hemolysin|nr:hemolysin family protein [Stellaceae bacterium]